jgi:hypothetical protein
MSVNYRTTWCNNPEGSHFQLAVCPRRHWNEDFEASTSIKLPNALRQEEEGI